MSIYENGLFLFGDRASPIVCRSKQLVLYLWKQNTTFNAFCDPAVMSYCCSIVRYAYIVVLMHRGYILNMISLVTIEDSNLIKILVINLGIPLCFVRW